MQRVGETEGERERRRQRGRRGTGEDSRVDDQLRKPFQLIQFMQKPPRALSGLQVLPQLFWMTK